LSPNGGETFVQGQNNVIQWSGITGTQSDIILTDVDGKRIGYVYSHLFMKGSSRQDLIYWDGNYVSSDGQFIGGANTAVKPGKYKIMVSSINGKVFDFSDAPFTIAAPTTATPSIKLLSPNGGEKLTTGQNYTITWSGVGSPEQVRILLYKGNALNIYETSTFGNIYGSIYFPPNSSSLALNITTGSDIGHYTWSIPANLATGDDYRIRIDLCEATGYCAISDQSDAPFTITVASAVTSPIISCDITAKAILNAVGSCSKLDSNKYPNVYKACCSVVTRETLLEILEKALQDGRIDENEKMDLLGALDRYLSARG
ncbi:MAG: GPI anchored serine-threonine rich family protein, partial [bacterium]|nr:GPI anchored serine-threonine rich family protein [bacterium]